MTERPHAAGRGTSRLEELARSETALGIVSLRRRRPPGAPDDPWIYEVKLDDDFLMSSAFTEGEVALATLALAHVASEQDVDVVVGGLGLGFTAHAVLADPRVRELVLVEALGEIVDWHERGLVPGGHELTSDPRSRTVVGDFFAMVADGRPLDGGTTARTFDAIVIDIDHSPRHVLHATNASLYTEAGLRRLATHLSPSGVVALWSNDPPDEEFLATMRAPFPDAAAHVVEFANPLQDRRAHNTVYLATAGGGRRASR